MRIHSYFKRNMNFILIFYIFYHFHKISMKYLPKNRCVIPSLTVTFWGTKSHLFRLADNHLRPSDDANY